MAYSTVQFGGVRANPAFNDAEKRLVYWNTLENTFKTDLALHDQFDGFSDYFSDDLGVDAGASSNFQFDSLGNYFENTSDGTLTSISVEADDEPTEGRIILCLGGESLTLNDATETNNDVRVYLSIDDGSNFDWMTVDYYGDLDENRKVYIGFGGLVDRSDKTLRLRLTTHNGKSIKLYYWGASWNQPEAVI